MKKQDEIPEGYVRVTDVLKPYSGLDGIDDRVLARAADRGTRVHDFCELYARNLLIEEPDEDCKVYFEAFKEWFDNAIEHVELIEERINSAKYKLTGKFDLLVRFNGDDELTIVDIKTPQNKGATWGLQTAAYRILLREEMGLEANRRGCLMLPNDSPRKRAANFIEYKDHDRDEELYLQALQLYRYFNG